MSLRWSRVSSENRSKRRGVSEQVWNNTHDELIAAPDTVDTFSDEVMQWRDREAICVVEREDVVMQSWFAGVYSSPRADNFPDGIPVIAQTGI